MKSIDIEKLKYPIGKFSRPDDITADQINNWIDILSHFPNELANLVKTLNAEELNWRYRPDGWSIRQVVHHCADSHINSHMRFKLALTEDNPTIKPYLEGKWAELPDTSSNIEWSLELISGLHKRWVFLLRNLTDKDLKKTFYHPEHKKSIALDETIALYAWHCKHHLEHVNQAIRYRGNF